MAGDTKAHLSQQDVDFYKKNGYLLFKNQLFSKGKLGQLTGIFEEQWDKVGRKMNSELDTPHFRDERLLQFLLSDEVLDLVEPLIGPNIALWSSHFISKEPLIGKKTPWHEDGAYWRGALSRYDNIVTVWLAIDRSTIENGCMGVIPGTHVNGFSDHEEVLDIEVFNREIRNVEESQAIYFELEPGECSLHDARIIHGAPPNKSPFRRCGYTMRYFSTDTKVLLAPDSGAKLWLVRGRDLAGNRYVNA